MLQFTWIIFTAFSFCKFAYYLHLSIFSFPFFACITHPYGFNIYLIYCGLYRQRDSNYFAPAPDSIILEAAFFIAIGYQFMILLRESPRITKSNCFSFSCWYQLPTPSVVDIYDQVLSSWCVLNPCEYSPLSAPKSLELTDIIFELRVLLSPAHGLSRLSMYLLERVLYMSIYPVATLVMSRGKLCSLRCDMS